MARVPMTIFFVNRFFHPDQSATSQLVSGLAFALAARGHEIEAVASRRFYDGPRPLLPARERINGVAVYRLWTTGFGRDGLKGRALDYLSFHISAAIHLWRRARRGDVVVAMTDPPLLSIAASLICRFRGAVAVNWIQDLFPEVAEAGGWMPRAGFARLRRLRDHSLRAAAMNIVIGQKMAGLVEAMGVAAARIRLIPNWADGDVIAPVDPAANPLRRRLACGDALVVGYSGNLGRVHEIETILAAMDILAAPEAAPRPILWLFTGGGARVPALRADVTRRGYTNVRFEPYQARDLLAQSLGAADVHLISLRPEFEGLVVPSKVYGIAAAGRPVIFIGDRHGEIAGLIETRGCGYCVAAGDGAALARTIGLFARQPSLAAALGAAARQAFELDFNQEIAFAQWENVLAALTHAQAPAALERAPP